MSGCSGQPAVSARREACKGAAALLLVLTCVAVVISTVQLLSADFEEPDCTGVQTESSCERCGRGTNAAPLFGEYEQSWPKWCRAVLYFVGLIWSFMGMGIVCDQFMAAIEAITSAETAVWVEIHSGSKRKFHRKVWNPTVANITLMALGSSTPEILLTAFELIGNNFFAGALGPFTIVGSAAFNLLVISAVCISAIPAPEVRKIEMVDVFCTTTTMSIWAYLWLVVIVYVISKDRIEWWEGALTFLMFPFLVVAAFIADKGWLRRCWSGGSTDPEVECQLVKQVQERVGKRLPSETVRILREFAEKASRPKISSRAENHSYVTRQLTGRQPGFTTKLRHRLAGSLYGHMGSDATPKGNSRGRTREVVIGFEAERHCVLECIGAFNIKVMASQSIGRVVELKYSTSEGTAKAGVRFEHVEGTLIFGPTQTERVIRIPIVDNDTWDPDEEFHVELEDLQLKQSRALAFSKSRSLSRSKDTLESTSTPNELRLQLGLSRTTITVLNDDDAGTLGFDVDEVQTTEGSTATICVVRSGGTSGKISCHYETVDATAIGGEDYEPVKGMLEFEDGEKHKSLSIPILVSKNHAYEAEEWFKVVINNASPGVKFNCNCSDAGIAVCDVVIAGGSPPWWYFRCIREHFNRDRFKLGMHLWSDQFHAVLYCNGTPEDQAEATVMDWFFHMTMLLWKLVFSLVPPPIFVGGWACFWVALIFIGLLTALVGDVASLLGCCAGIPDEMTAITLVALGTSLPDTFTSKTAAQQEETADNSIGNIMGSNSVNVFLGLGISWTMGAVYWKFKGATPEWRQRTLFGTSYEELFRGTDCWGGFIVPSGGLLFSVLVYTSCALVCITLLKCRRRKYGGELGGPEWAQRRDSWTLLMLWLLYVAIVSFHAISQS